MTFERSVKAACAVLLLLLFVVAPLVFLCYTMGPFDFLHTGPIVVAEVRNAAGDRFRLTQIHQNLWEYATYPEHISPDGRLDWRLLNIDDPKLWSCALDVDENTNTLSILYPRERTPRAYDWRTRQIHRLHGSADALQ